VHRSTIDEKSIRDTDAAALRKKLTEAKARKIASAFDDAVVASGDAVAAKDTKLFEKPRSNDEAVEFLRELSDSAFQLCDLAHRASFRHRQKALRGRNFRDQIPSTKRPWIPRLGRQISSFARASRATAFCASLTPFQAATT
jgi:hypothetical protein